MNLITLAVGGLAVWRLSHALVKEAGPLMVFTRLRAFLARTQKRSGGLFDAFSCVYCISFWTGLVASLRVSQNVFQWIAYGLAFSGVSMLLESLFSKQSDSLAVVTRPTADNKVLVGRSTAPEQGNDVVSNPNPTYGSVAVKATTLLND